MGRCQTTRLAWWRWRGAARRVGVPRLRVGLAPRPLAGRLRLLALALRSEWTCPLRSQPAIPTQIGEVPPAVGVIHSLRHARRFLPLTDDPECRLTFRHADQAREDFAAAFEFLCRSLEP
jgi:hypothetical protein